MSAIYSLFNEHILIIIFISYSCQFVNVPMAEAVKAIQHAPGSQIRGIPFDGVDGLNCEKLDRGLDLKTRLGSATIPHTKYILCIFRKRIGAFSHYKRLKCTSLLSSPYLFQWKSKVVDRLDPSLPSYLYILCLLFIFNLLLFVICFH